MSPISKLIWSESAASSRRVWPHRCVRAFALALTRSSAPSSSTTSSGWISTPIVDGMPQRGHTASTAMRAGVRTSAENKDAGGRSPASASARSLAVTTRTPSHEPPSTSWSRASRRFRSRSTTATRGLAYFGTFSGSGAGSGSGCAGTSVSAICVPPSGRLRDLLDDRPSVVLGDSIDRVADLGEVLVMAHDHDPLQPAVVGEDAQGLAERAARLGVETVGLVDDERPDRGAGTARDQARERDRKGE